MQYQMEITLKLHEAELVFVDFERVLNFTLKKLYLIDPPRLSHLIAIEHIHSLPQFRGRCRLDARTLTAEKLSQLGLEGIEREALEEAARAISELFEYRDGALKFSAGAIEQLKAETERSTTMILRINAAPAANKMTSAPPPSEIILERQTIFKFANNLFGQGMKNTGFDYKEGNDALAEIIKRQEIDLSDLCEWRKNKQRPKIETNIKSVEKEWEIFKKPKTSPSGMKPKERKKRTAPREISLTLGDEKNV